MKITVAAIYAVLILSGIILIPNAFAENVPDWVKNTAGWWATDAISETEFVNAVEFLVKENIIQVNASQSSETSQGVPDWVKNTAGWWATDAISETEFVNAIAYLIENGMINIESIQSPELIAEMWVNGNITDDEFLVDVERLIEKDVITIQSHSITNMSDLPDWLVNNAGWWAARIFTNSDFDFDPGYVKERIFPCENDSPDYGCFESSWTYNSYGFRGNQFEKEKPDNTFRIFAVGGSTTFGWAAFDNETWPGHLQQMINEKITDKEIEIINSGKSGATSNDEYGLIKNKILSLDPDLIIMYDGWNDSQFGVANEKTIQNWESICKLGNDEGFETIIIVQPIPITGKRVLTEQEIGNSFGTSQSGYPQASQQYVDGFEELDKTCTKTADFRRIFDYVQEPVFYDGGHTMSFGNKIIAENVFSVISPIYFEKTYSVTHNIQTEKNESGADVVYAVGSDLSNRNFDDLNLQNAVFDKADLSNTSFKNTNIEGARFVFANLDNSNLLDRTDLANINLAGTDLSDVSLEGKNLSGTILMGADLTGKILKDTDLSGMDLSYSILKDANLSNADLSGTNLSYTDLRSSDLSGTILSDSILFRADFSKNDLRTAKLDNADFRYAILSESKFPDSLLVNNNFDFAHLKNINFAGKDLSGSNFTQVTLDGSDMQNANLTNAVFVQVDFTKIKSKSLAGANLSVTSLAHSNLSGVDLSDVKLYGTHLLKATLTGLDFTVVSNENIDGVIFIESKLSNSNFEGVDMSPKRVFSSVLKNAAYLINSDSIDIINQYFGEAHILILSREVHGNDLALNYIYYNAFARANLENANFKNAKLWNANFYLAELPGADLSGAELKSAFLEGANLSNANLSNADLTNANLIGANLTNANLEGANLDGMLYNENTVLKCKNHSICESN